MRARYVHTYAGCCCVELRPAATPTLVATVLGSSSPVARHQRERMLLTADTGNPVWESPKGDRTSMVPDLGHFGGSLTS